jgi:hypothetical protein
MSKALVGVVRIDPVMAPSYKIRFIPSSCKKSALLSNHQHKLCGVAPAFGYISSIASPFTQTFLMKIT